MNNTSLFLKDLVEDGFVIETDQIHKDRITCVNLNEAYNTWCTRYNIKYMLKALKAQLKILDITEKNVRYNKEMTRCYIMNPDSLKESFRKMLNDPKFEFQVRADE